MTSVCRPPSFKVFAKADSFPMIRNIPAAEKYKRVRKDNTNPAPLGLSSRRIISMPVMMEVTIRIIHVRYEEFIRSGTTVKTLVGKNLLMNPARQPKPKKKMTAIKYPTSDCRRNLKDVSFIAKEIPGRVEIKGMIAIAATNMTGESKNMPSPQKMAPNNE